MIAFVFSALLGVSAIKETRQNITSIESKSKFTCHKSIQYLARNLNFIFVHVIAMHNLAALTALPFYMWFIFIKIKVVYSHLQQLNQWITTKQLKP